MDTLQKLDPTDLPITSLPATPITEFGLALKQTAMLIKAEVGLEVSAIDLGGWDTHFTQGSTSGLMPYLMKDLAEGLAAFHADMADHMNKLTSVTMSEFGRRAYENGSLGTDHGHGSTRICRFILDQELNISGPARFFYRQCEIFLLRPKLHHNKIPIRPVGKISIADADLGGLCFQNCVAVDFVVHPPTHRRLWTSAAVDDLLGE